jgi:transcriptional regulator with XRE-family HTH domain
MVPNRPRLREWREQHGLTQTAAAAVLGVQQPVWSEWESGGRIPKLRFAVELARITDGAVPVDGWVDVENDGRPPASD